MENHVLKLFGKRLRKIRLEKGLSQVEVAYRANFDRNYIGMLERGERNPALKNLIRLAKGLDIGLLELLDFEYND